MAYTTLSPTTGFLEMLTIATSTDIIRLYGCEEWEIPDDIIIDIINVKKLSKYWAQIDPFPQETLILGSEWIKGNRSVRLEVPAAVMTPAAKNLLINPAHSDFSKIKSRGFTFPMRVHQDILINTKK